MNSEPLEKVLAAIGEYRKSGASFKARCPGHEDRSPSLSISAADDGTVLVKCHTGCTTEEVVRALGLEMRDLFPRLDENTATRNTGEKRGSSTAMDKSKKFPSAAEAVADLEKFRGKRSASWVYRDAQGEPVGVIVRWDKEGEKTIRPVAKIGAEWVQGGMPTPRPLYRLPELLQSTGPVYITEGEKAADALQDLGFTVTTSAHGAKSAKGTDWSPLAGRELVILPDNDKAGANYAAEVVDLLSKLTPKPCSKVVNLPGLPDAGDAVDFITQRRQAGLDDAAIREEIVTMVSAAQQPGGSTPAVSAPRPSQSTEPCVTTLDQAALEHLESIKGGKTPLLTLGLSDLDSAIGGGIQKGEMVIFAARPSHGKSAVALQFVHHWTAKGMPCAFISEEMSKISLGKRTLQFISTAPQENWPHIIEHLEADVKQYASSHAPCYVIENSGTVEKAAAEIERHVKNHGVQCVVVDYAQLLTGKGRDRYEQVSNVSVVLRKLASFHNLVMLVLCQMNRDIEGREEFKPRMRDLRESGQLEQDADVIVFLCWPCRLNDAEPKEKFQFFVQKNRNREIKKFALECRFLAGRQMFLDAYDAASDEFPPVPDHWQRSVEPSREDD